MRFTLKTLRVFLRRNISEAAVSNTMAEEDPTKKRPLIEDTQIIDAKKQKVEVDRIKRKKVALLMCYSGLGYLGMQRNPGTKTIEEDLMKALLKSSLITEEAYITPQQVMFQRAARTDKGVSAARQVVSLKLPEKSKVEEINEHLPEQIRVLGLKRVTKNFNSKSSCDARTYSYMLPTFAFTPSGQAVDETFRISPEIMEKVRETMKLFEGTHNFHNFTSRRKPLDPSNNRYIMSFEAEEPFVSGELEMVVLKVKGQSFMLHQIRKMVGLAVAVVSGLAPAETVSRAWRTAERLDIPVAPGAGLVLEEIHYDRYNQKFGKDGIHECLDWHEYDEDVAKFKKKFIHPAIVETETKEKSMLNWLVTLPLHSYDVRENHVNDTAPTEQEEDGIQAGDD
ncbi:pseudouridylate synthase 1 homolog [Bacillus rossius redtenbacheri]|uniref:pseudouridylate synthase 1 homolog n=1 Tax=Bacillus rossius redtenbacheri TaxID=93214 RepID=UPI002FDE106F